MQELGLALSGGGSRAIAFHRGTVRALNELGLVEALDVVSTVSGGSVFGAAWMCALAAGENTVTFLDRLQPVLTRGFIWPALLSLRALQIFLPHRNRTHRLAETFDELLTGGHPLAYLPVRPQLCLNATVLNHGAVGRFSRNGFSCQSVGTRLEGGSYPENPVPVTVGFAAAASAAFPFGLPPLTLPARYLEAFEDPIRDHHQLVLTDGGVLENLGVQLLLRSRRFGTRNIIVSDAGTAEVAWRPTVWGRAKSFGAFALSADTLSQLLAVMNDKQNKSMREIVMHEVGSLDPPEADRSLWFVRIDQTWNRFLQGIPLHQRRLIAGGKDMTPPVSAGAEEVSKFLGKHGVELSQISQRYRAMGGDDAVARANAIRTQFTGLHADTLALLERHAAWQVHACHAVYGGFEHIAAKPKA